MGAERSNGSIPNQMSPHLQELPRRLLALEEDAYREFARIFRGRFYRYFLTQGMPQFEAEDLAASLTTDALMKVEKYEPREGAAFESWVYQLMRHAAADWHRRQKGRSVSAENLAEQFEPAAPPDREVVAAVREALEELSEEDRTIVEMRDMEGEGTYEEIAAAIGVSAGALRVRRHRALRRLEKLLAEDARIRLRPLSTGVSAVSEEKMS